MRAFAKLLNTLLVASLPAFLPVEPLSAQDAASGTPHRGERQDVRTQAQVLDDLFAELADPEAGDWQRVEKDIQREWSRSGSPAMDLLLQRGRDAMEAGDFQAAIEHLTALTDHAPDFAEGWNARATAFYQAGQFGPSLDDIRTTLRLNPRHFGALSGLGMILEELDHLQDALKIYRAALAIHPHQPGITAAIERLDTGLAGQNL